MGDLRVTVEHDVRIAANGARVHAMRMARRTDAGERCTLS